MSYIQSLEVGGSWHWFGGSSNTRINIPVTVFVFVYGVKKAATPAILSILRQEERGYAHDTCVFFSLFLAVLGLRCFLWLLSSWQRTGFSLQGLLLLWSTGSRHTGFSSLARGL